MTSLTDKIADLDFLDIPVAVTTLDLVVLHCNAAFEAVVGMSVGTCLNERIPEVADRRAQRKLEKRKVLAVMGMGVGGRGESTPFEYRFRPIDEDGSSLWLVQGLDQTRMQAKEHLLVGFTKTIELNNRRLAVQQRAMADLLNNMSQAVFAVNKGGRVCAPVSGHTQQVFGRDITGEKIATILFEDKTDDQEFPWRQIGSAEHAWRATEGQLRVAYVREPGAAVRYLQVSTAPICHGDGDTAKIAKVLFMVDDVTELVELEATHEAHIAAMSRQHTDEVNAA